jgi:amidase
MAMLIRAMQMIDPSFTPVELERPPVLGRLAVSASVEITEAITQALTYAAPEVHDVTVADLDAAYEAGLSVINAETWAAVGALTHSGKVGADVAGRLLAASHTTPEDVARAETVRDEVSSAIDAALEGLDALVLPTMPDVPPTLAEAADSRSAIGITALVRAFNLSGHPALSIPVRTASGLPAGLQLVGRKGADAQLCAVAAWIEGRLPQARRIWPVAA